MIIRRKHNSGYATVSRAAFEDERLSIEARGLLGYLLVKPDNWEVNISDIRKRCGIGKDKAYRLINELIEAGYIQRIELRDEKGRVSGTEHIVRDEPDAMPPEDVPLPENPDTDNPEALIKTKGNNSVSNDTGPSPSKMIWEKGLSLLARAYPENSEIKNRTLIGKWFKRIDGDHDRFLAVLDACEAAGTMDPVSYISKAVDNQWPEKPKPPDPKDISADRWKINIRVAMERQEWPKTWGPPPGAKGCCVPADLVTPELLELFKPEGALV